MFNITHSLERWNQGRNNGILDGAVRRGDLTSYINKVLEYNNRQLLASIINSDCKSHDIGSLADLLAKSGSADPECVQAIIHFLKEMDVLYELPGKSGEPNYLFTQSGMRYSQAKDEAEALLNTDVFCNGEYSMVEQKKILDKLEQDISGHVLEDIVLYQGNSAFNPFQATAPEDKVLYMNVETFLK